MASHVDRTDRCHVKEYRLVKTKGKRILVVEDDASIQRALRRSLTISGYEVLVVDNGRQAVELVREQQPDLVLLDLSLPGEIDGLGVCIQVRQWSQIPIIIVSARTDEQQKVQALDLGADDYLTKPFSNEELLARVRVCLRRAASQANSDRVRAIAPVDASCWQSHDPPRATPLRLGTRIRRGGRLPACLC